MSLQSQLDQQALRRLTLQPALLGVTNAVPVPDGPSSGAHDDQDAQAGAGASSSGAVIGTTCSKHLLAQALAAHQQEQAEIERLEGSA